MAINKIEGRVKKSYIKKGFKSVRCGYPDFIFYKEKNGKISNVEFVEVKTCNDKLSKEQKICKMILESLGLNYKVIEEPSYKKRGKKYTSIALKKTTKKELNKLKKYPRETGEEIVLRLINKNLKNERK